MLSEVSWICVTPVLVHRWLMLKQDKTAMKSFCSFTVFIFCILFVTTYITSSYNPTLLSKLPIRAWLK